MSTRSGRLRPSAVESSPPALRKGVSPPRSPGRTRKSSPARSPSRKSPSRKSPSRKPATKIPARKSPSRPTEPKKSPVKRAAIKPDLEVQLVDLTKLESYRTRRRTEIKDTNSQEAKAPEKVNGFDSGKDVYGIRSRKSVEEIVPRRSGRIQEMIENDIKRSLSKSVSKSVSQSLNFSDESGSESERKDKSRSITRKLATPIRDSISRLAQYSGKWEFGGRIGSGILIILLPLTVLSILLACKKTCAASSVSSLSAFQGISHYYNPTAILLVVSQILLQAFFACLPVFGTKADISGKKYQFNAFFASIVTVSILFSLEYFQIFAITAILRSYTQLATVSYVFGLILAIGLFIKSRNLDDGELNPYGNTGYRVYDFWMGREIHPHFRRLDFKIWTSRICNISTLILTMLIFRQGIIIPTPAATENAPETYNDILSKLQFKPTILLYSMMQLIYVLNYIMREYKITSTFYWQSEGLGYLQIISSALYPFYFTTVSKYVASSGLELSVNVLVGASFLYLLGFVIMLISNNIKYEFRKNPTDARLSNLETMPTFHGKKLLISNLWGKLRHPNYTGDILIHIALALPGIISQQYIASAPALLTILTLLHRAWRDHSRCKRRYGAAWQRYCKRVPSLIIPKVL